MIEVDSDQFGFLKVNNIQNTLSGDLKDDNDINILEVICLVNIILGFSDSIAGSDLNQDNLVNVLDVIQLMNIILS